MLTFMRNIHEYKFVEFVAFEANTNVFQANTNVSLKNLETQVRKAGPNNAESV